MSVGENTRQALREIGLSAYEIDVYVALLESGQMTAMEVSKKALVPYSKIYEVLNSLKEKGWIKTLESRPSKHYPTSPMEAMASIRLRLEDKYKNWEQIIVGELEPLYEKRELVERPDILILRGQQGVRDKLTETFARAKKEIMIAFPEFAKTMIASAEFSWEGLEKTRVEVRLLAAGKAEDWLFLKRFPGIGELRIRDQMFGGGIIADGKEAMLFLGEDKPSLVIWSNHVGLVGFAREYFQFLWDSSTTA